MTIFIALGMAIAVVLIMLGIDVGRDKSIIRGLFGDRSKVLEMARYISPGYQSIFPENKRTEMAETIDAAGRPYGIGISEFYGVELAAYLLGCCTTVVLVFIGGPVTLGFIIVPSIGYLPRLTLKGIASARRAKIRYALPMSVGMLTKIIGAGVELNEAFRRISRSAGGPLGEELNTALSEHLSGRPLSMTLRAAADRVGERSFTKFTQVMSTAEQRGAKEVVMILSGFYRELINEQDAMVDADSKKMETQLLEPTFEILGGFMIIILTPIMIVFYSSF